MERDKFLRTMQQMMAYRSLTPSNLDFNSEVDIIKDVRNFGTKLDLSRFATEDPEKFAKNLDSATDRLAGQMSANRHNWGTARTAVNLYLQAAHYNRYLSESFHLYLSEHFYELPLNKRSADGIRKQRPGDNLPEWPGLTLLDAAGSSLYQEAAKAIASDMGVARIHLGLFLWPGW